MKVKYFLVVLLAIFLVVANVIAQNNTAQPAPATSPAPPTVDSNQEKMNAEQVQQAKKFLEQLVEPKQQTTTGSNKTPESKTMADVLDKGVDMFAGYVTSVSEMIKNIAPDVWRIMIRQQYAKAVSYVIQPFFFLLMVFVYHWFAKRWFKISAEDKLVDFSTDGLSWRTGFLSIIPMIAGLGCGIWFTLGLSSAMQILINPEYYALKDLISMILGKQTM